MREAQKGMGPDKIIGVLREQGAGVGIAAGIVAGTALGAYAYGYPRRYVPRYESDTSGPECYQGPRQCFWHGRSCWHKVGRISLLATDDLRLGHRVDVGGRRGLGGARYHCARRRMAARCNPIAVAFETLSELIGPAVPMRRTCVQVSRVN